MEGGVNTAESGGELSQALRIEVSRLAQLQALQMLLKDFFSFLKGEEKPNQKNQKKKTTPDSTVSLKADERAVPDTSTFPAGPGCVF